MSDEVGLIVLALVFAVGVALVALVMILVLPGAMLAEMHLSAVLDRRKKHREEPDT